LKIEWFAAGKTSQPCKDSPKYVDVLSYPINRQTDKQTDRQTKWIHNPANLGTGNY